MVEPSCFLVSASTNQSAAIDKLDQSAGFQLDGSNSAGLYATLPSVDHGPLNEGPRGEI